MPAAVSEAKERSASHSGTATVYYTNSLRFLINPINIATKNVIQLIRNPNPNIIPMAQEAKLEYSPTLFEKTLPHTALMNLSCPVPFTSPANAG